MEYDPTPMDVARLVAEYHQTVYRYAYRLTGSVADAEDLTQQVFMTAQAKLGQLRDSACVRGWLFAILRNRYLKTTRKRFPVPAASICLTMEDIPAEVPSSEAIDREALQQALDQLPPPYRVVLGMFYYEDCSYREIAEKLNLPIGTVMSRLARAKSHLRAVLLRRSVGGGTSRTPVKAMLGG